VVCFLSYTDVQVARDLLGIVGLLAAPCAVYYEVRPHDPRRAEVHAAMRRLQQASRLVRCRVISPAARLAGGCFPWMQGSTTHFKAVVADDDLFLYGSGNAIAETCYMHDPAAASCRAAAAHFFAPSFLDFDVVFGLTEPATRTVDLLVRLAERRPGPLSSHRLALADGCELHVLPAGACTREETLVALVRGARRSVTLMSTSVWLSGRLHREVAAAARRCRVTLVSSAYECSRSQRLFTRLNRAAAFRLGCEYREWTTEDGFVHAKFGVFDGTVALPSFNFSCKAIAACVDDESLLVLRGKAAAGVRAALLALVEARSLAVAPERDLLGGCLLACLSRVL
jgi:phosphatidylserine/phosphatidylglycerophosphate/cardiolipin synthase-like enzyme